MTGECEAEFRLHDFADGSMAYLTCSLAADHPELHWDRTLNLAWSPWTEAEEQAAQDAVVPAAGPGNQP